MKVYLASPIAQTKEKDSWGESREKLSRNEIISQKLKEIGLDVYLPQINQKETEAETLTEQLEVIKNRDFFSACFIRYSWHIYRGRICKSTW